MSILTDRQRQFLKLVSENDWLTSNFYLGGGTALAEFYLQHRYSEDLDFFSEQEFDPFFITTIFKKIREKAGIERVAYEQSFNRNLFFLGLKSESIKTEFTYFPFSR